MTHASVLDVTGAAAESSGGERFHAQLQEFRKTVARVSETISVLFVPGVNDVGAYLAFCVVMMTMIMVLQEVQSCRQSR